MTGTGTSVSTHRRTDIDGLRAVAVLMVLFFHLDVPGFAGGFIGVDVFFVISGYLITSIILRQRQDSRLSFSNFYLRRAQRLLPALLFTLLVSFFAGLLIFSDQLFIELARYIQSVMLLIPNVHQWQDLGYFHTQANFKPLFHLWSLGVEEQFYLIWPLAFSLICRLSVRAQLIMTAFLATVSVLLSQLWLSVDQDAAFYLLPFRGVGLIFGTLLAHLHFHRTIPISKHPNRLSILAAFVLAFCTIFYDRGTRYPGIASLLPVLATVMIIHGGWQSDYRSIFSRPFLTRIGLSSYSLYLIHWPIIVYYTNWVYRPLNTVETLGLSAASILAALAMYRVIEKPIIYARLSPGSSRAFAVGALAAAGLFLSITVFFLLDPRENPLVPDNRRQIIEPTYYGFEKIHCRTAPPVGSGCYFGTRKPGGEDILLIGDSHALMLASGLDRFAHRHGLKVRAWTRPGCPPLPGAMKHSHNEGIGASIGCYQHNQRIVEFVTEYKPPVVMLAARWSAYTEPTETYGMYKLVNRYFADPNRPELTVQASRNQFRQKLGEMVNTVRSIGGKVIFVGPIPELGGSPERCRVVPEFITQSHIDQRCASLSYAKTMNRLSYANETFSALAATDVLPLRLSDVFCDEQVKRCDHMSGPSPLFFDNHHVNNLGSTAIVDHFEDDLVSFLGLNERDQ